MADPEWLCDDALPWLQANRGQCGAVITSPPDAAELEQYDADAYTAWLARAVARCYRATTPGQPTIFYVTDRLGGGRWYSKPGLIARVAATHHTRLLWHKIVLRRDVGATDLHRPGYAHLVAYGDKTVRTGKRTPDVIAPSPATYINGTPARAVSAAVAYAATSATLVTDPFCGRGAIPLRAAQAGLAAVGVNISPDMIAHCHANTAYQLALA